MTPEERAREAYEYTKWIVGIEQYAKDNPTEMRRFADASTVVLANITESTLEKLGPIGIMVSDPMVQVVSMVAYYGYYLGKFGLDADPPAASDQILCHIRDNMTPNCDCPICQGKKQLLMERGIPVSNPPTANGLSFEEWAKQFDDLIVGDLKDLFEEN